MKKPRKTDACEAFPTQYTEGGVLIAVAIGFLISEN